jgi:RNA polymerase sigma-70 factor (ECF subfamily)
MSSTPSTASSKSPAFATTHWSVVMMAGEGDGTRARDALARLCKTYWYPLYSYVRRRGHSPEDAQDLTQEFLFRLLEKNWVATADRSRGRFRSFLLSAMKHFLADEWDKARAQKRGGGLPHLELNNAETRFLREPADTFSPETSYEWDGKTELFNALHPCLVGDRASQPYAELAKTLGTAENTIKSAVHRLRQRYRQLLHDEIANTVAGPDEVEAELRHLFAVLRG